MRGRLLWGRGRMQWAAGMAAGLAAALLSLPAEADLRRSQAWFEGLGSADRAELQKSLVLLAHYGGLVDGAFGAETYGALLEWEHAAGGTPDGVLSAAEAQRLKQMAETASAELGLSIVEDWLGHLRILLPTGLLGEQQPGIDGTRYESADREFAAETFWRSGAGTLAQQFASVTAPAPARTVGYSVLREDFYVVSGTENGRYFYELARSDALGVAGFRFTYTERYRQVGGVSSVLAASYSVPIAALPPEMPEGPETRLAAPLPEPKLEKPVATVEAGTHAYGAFTTFDDAPGVMILIGEIGPGTPLEFRRAVKAAGVPQVLALASDGGLVASALLLAYEVRELGLSTWVPPDTGCYSACAFVFLAGADRLAEGELGVHQVWGEQVDASAAQTVVSDILEAFGSFGVRQEVTSAMLRTRPEEMHVFSPAELAAWGLNQGDPFGAQLAASVP